MFVIDTKFIDWAYLVHNTALFIVDREENGKLSII